MSDLLNQASLVMVPSGYKEDTVYSVVPTDGSGDLSFTRASNGTRVNSAGLVEVVPWNFVEQSSNLSSWTTAGVTITTGITDAFGTTNAVTMGLISSGSNTDYIVKYSNAMALPTGTQINYSVYLKGSGTIGVIIERSVSGDYFYQQQGVTLSNTWTRYDFAYTIGVGVNANGISFYVSNLTGTTATSVDICFPQINYGSTAKPYFPTTDRLNVPRLTYQNGGGGCPSLLLEKQSTNVCLYSEQIDNASWDKVNGSGGTAPVVTANYGISPDGTQNADRVQLARTTAAGSYSYVYQTITLSASATYTVSVYLKSLSGTPTISIALDGVGYDHVVTMTTEWARYEVEIVAGGSFDRAQLLLYQAVASTSLTADFLAWGFQVEQSSYPTSYIPTTSSSATRVADACSKTGISSLIGQTQGVLFVDLVITGTTGNNRFSISDGSNTNWIFIGTPEDGATRSSRFYIKTNGVVRVDTGTSSYFTIGQRYKLALAYKSGDWAVYANGSLLYSGTDSIGSVSSALSAFDFFNTSGGTADTGEQINQAILFPTRLTNSELASLTTI